MFWRWGAQQIDVAAQFQRADLIAERVQVATDDRLMRYQWQHRFKAQTLGAARRLGTGRLVLRRPGGVLPATVEHMMCFLGVQFVGSPGGFDMGRRRHDEEHGAHKRAQDELPEMMSKPVHGFRLPVNVAGIGIWACQIRVIGADQAYPAESFASGGWNCQPMSQGK